MNVVIPEPPNRVRNLEDEALLGSVRYVPVDMLPAFQSGSIKQMTLGELWAVIGRLPSDCHVFTDQMGMPPTKEIRSYRGYYEHAALGVHDKYQTVTVEEMLTMLAGTIGQLRRGYKGGDYRMDRNVPVWLSNYGDASGCALVGVDHAEGEVVLRSWFVGH